MLQSQNLRDGDNPSSQDTSTCSTADLFQKFLQRSHITEWGLQKHQHLKEQDIFSGSIHNQQSVKCLLWIQRVYYMEPIIFINFSCLVEVSHKKLKVVTWEEPGQTDPSHYDRTELLSLIAPVQPLYLYHFWLERVYQDYNIDGT